MVICQEEKMEFIDETIYPPEVSAGGINAFYMPGCDHVGHRPSYAICLNKIMHYERNGKLDDLHGCGQQISSKLCPALKLRAEEKAAGKAIYFIHREKLQAFKSEQDQQQRAAVEAKSAIKRDPNTMKFPAEVNLARGLPADHVDHFHIGKGKPHQPAPKKDTGLLAHSGASYADAINAALAAPATMPEPAPAPQKVASSQPAPAVPFKAGMSLLEMAKARLAASSQL